MSSREKFIILILYSLLSIIHCTVDNMLEVFQLPFLSKTVIDNIFASCAMPLYFPFDDNPFPAKMPVQCLPCTVRQNKAMLKNKSNVILYCNFCLL